jgi:arylsulfatase A-like enzyme
VPAGAHSLAPTWPVAVEVSGPGDPDRAEDGIEDHARWLLSSRAASRLRARTWRSSPEVASLLSRARHMNVLLVMVDALRAAPFHDPVASAERLPNIGALRRRARWFTNAFAPAAGTDLCVGGVLTGNRDPMAGAAFTLPELLAAAGFASHAVVPREVVRGTSQTLITRGFRHPDILVTDPGAPNVPESVSSDQVTNLGLSFVDRWQQQPGAGEGRPFFLWLHYFDVHEHHQLPDDLPAIVAHNEGRVPRDASEKYQALLEIVDEELGRLFAGIASRGLEESTIVVFAADHGESLKEDPRLPANHGLVLYNPLVHIPLAIAVPGLKGGDDSSPVSLLDLPVTLLDLVGRPAPPSMNAGQSLLPSLGAMPDQPTIEEQPRTLVLNESDQFGVIRWPYKLLVRRASQAAELYDLSRDFAEFVDLAPSLPRVVASLAGAYRAFPAIKLDRTRAGRKQFEELAQLTRPDRVALVKSEKKADRMKVAAAHRRRLKRAARLPAGARAGRAVVRRGPAPAHAPAGR